MRRIVWLGCLFSSLLVAAQGPPFAEWPAELQEHFGVAGEILDHAFRYRSVPVRNFSITNINVGWGVSILNAGQDGSSMTVIVTFKPPDHPEFYVQGIICGEGKDAHLFDTTVLGPTETGADFYQDNIGFFTPDLNSKLISCFSAALITGSVSKKDTNDPKIGYFDSPDRAIRHLCYWARFFRTRDKKRAADFLVTALDQEKILLQEMEAKQKYSELSLNLNLFDKRLPPENLDPSLPLDKGQLAEVRSWLAMTIRMRGKLNPFLPGAAERIAQDEALLARLR